MLRSTAHSFENRNGAVATCLSTLMPGVLGQGYFRALAALVAEGCVVLSEMREVVQPPEAVVAYNDFVAEWAARHARNATSSTTS